LYYPLISFGAEDDSYAMKNNEEKELYVSPTVEYLIQIYEGVLCQSKGTHEGVDFENWN
jgi:hypothetical protein